MVALMRIARRIMRPDAHGLEQGVLDRILDRREVCSATNEDSDDRRCEGSEKGLVH